MPVRVERTNRDETKTPYLDHTTGQNTVSQSLTSHQLEMNLEFVKPPDLLSRSGLEMNACPIFSLAYEGGGKLKG
jgi:hypothetical protein